MTDATDADLRTTSPHARMPVWLGDLIAGVLIIAGGFLPIPGQEFQPPELLGVVVAIVPALILPLRRRWPVSILIACLALFGVSAFIGILSPGLTLAVAIATFGVTNRSPLRKTLIVAGCAVIAIPILSLPVAINGAFEPRVLQLAFAVAFGAAAGYGVRQQRNYFEAITERAERAETTREAEAQRRVSEERLRIARDLHDAVAHQISVISLNAGVASSVIDSNPAKSKESLARIRMASRAVLGEIGDLLGMLRSDDSPVVDGPQPGLARLDELVAQFDDVGLEVTVRTEGDVSTVSGAVDLVAFRVVQESLTNANKHGSGRRAHVLIEAGPEALHVIVTNPVESSGAAQASTGFGLLGLRERVASVRGSTVVEVRGGTWRVDVTIPLARDDA